MTFAACLALYGLLVAVGGPAALRRGQTACAPRLAVLVWVIIVVSAVAALAGAVVVAVAMMVDGLLLEPGRLHGLATLEALGLGGAAPAIMGVPAVAGAGWLVRATWRAARTLATARRTHLRLATQLRTLGRMAPGLGPDTLVVASPERAVYCLAGRRRTVVVASGALDALAPDELAAVLAHERAHLAGRHHLPLVVARAVRRVMPPLPLFADAEAELTRLLEMRADDAATRRHGTRPLLAALVALTDHPGVPGALGAASTALLDRAHRLVQPPTDGERAAARRALLGNLAALVLGPLLALLAMALTVCPLIAAW